MTIVTVDLGGHDGHVYTDGDPGDVSGALRFAATAHPDEPLFVIRGRDALAVPTLRAYITECEGHGLDGQAQRAWGHLRRFQVWQRVNAKLCNLPDPLPQEDSDHWPSRPDTNQANDGITPS